MKIRAWLSYVLLLAGGILLTLSTCFLPNSDPKKIIPEESEGHLFSKRDRIELAMRQEIEMTRDPATGTVPRERLLSARTYADRLRRQPVETRGAIAGVNWTERGPNNAGGRTRALLVDPNDPSQKAVFAAGVSGGMWYTPDITASVPQWQPIDDFFDNLAITCIAADPSNPQVIYFGTGEGYFNADAVRGLGIWKSTDGGQNWAPLAITRQSTFSYVYDLEVTVGGVLLAATRNGLQRSTNGGATWSRTATGCGSNRYIYDIELAANGDVYISGRGCVLKSTNAGQSFTQVTALPFTASRVEIATAPSDANYIYVLAEYRSRVAGILLSTDGGQSWTQRVEPNDADPGIPATDFSRNQGWYNLCIAVSPNDRDVLFVGGIDLFKSTNGGVSWQQISHWWGGYGYQNVHADQHNIVFEPGNPNVVYFTNDGGVYRTDNGQATIPTLVAKEQNYRTLQFYACALHPQASSNHFLAGSQDNGSHRFSQPGLGPTVEVTGGDGGFCHIDQDEPQFQFTSYVYSFFRRSTNGGNSFISANYGNAGRFINPTDYDNDANKLYAAAGSGQFLRWEDPQSGFTFSLVNAGFNGQVSAVSCDPNTANQVFFATSAGAVYRVANAHNTPATVVRINSGSGMPSGYIGCIEIDPNDSDHLLVTYTNYGLSQNVWETSDGGASWTGVEGNLPDMPVRWALFDPDDPTRALLATELGVWSTTLLDGGNTQWGPTNGGLANVRVTMLQYRESDGMVIASTHGRGVYSSDVFMQPRADFTAERRVGWAGYPLSFDDLSERATSWSWDFGDGGQSTQAEPSHTYTQAGQYTVTLSINQGASTKTETQFVTILPKRGRTYLLSDGGNFEQNASDFAAESMNGSTWELGSSTILGKNGTASGNNAWVTELSSNYQDQSTTYLYTPMFDLSNSAAPELRFKSRFYTERDFDGFRVEYTTDAGASWQVLGGYEPGWYNFMSANTTAFPPNEPFFSGNFSASFQPFSYPLTAVAGQPALAFRFVFQSDQSVRLPGVAIDDFEMDGGSLPVEWLSFSGDWEGPYARLHWETAQEIQNAGFQIERSEDGTLFTPVGYVAGAGNASQTMQYIFDDQPGEFLEVVHYRLRQIDIDGGFDFSPVILLRRQPVPLEVRAYPIPMVDELTLELPRTGTLTLVNVKNQILRRRTYRPGTHHLQLDDLPTGTYILRIDFGEGETVSRKLTKR